MKLQKKSQSSREWPFLRFLWQKENRIEMLVWIVISIAIFIVLDYCYPYFFYFSDTWTYLQTSISGIYSCYRPPGYVWFINFCHSLSPSYKMLIGMQFFLHIVSSLFLGYTIKYFFFKNKQNLWSKLIFWVMMVFLLWSPALIFTTKYVMSEGFFGPLLLFWGASLIWLLHSRNWLMLVFNLLTLYLIIQTRYVGMIFAVISLIVILYSFKKTRFFDYVACLAFIGCMLYCNVHVKKMHKKQYGIYSSNGFGGWARANCVLSLMPDVMNFPAEELKNPAFRDIHRTILSFPDSVFNEENLLATGYIWNSGLPLKKALFEYMDKYQMSYSKAWIRIGKTFGDYSLEIIKRYPWDYFKRFILWNTKFCFKTFQIDQNDSFVFAKEAQELYGFEPKEDEPFKYTFFKDITPVRKVFNAGLWILVFVGIGFWIVKFKTFSRFQNQVLILLALWVILYIAGSVVAHPVNNFRYILPVLAPRLVFCAIIAVSFLPSKPKKKEEIIFEK